MAFDWSEYLALAGSLQARAGIDLPAEAALRSTVSRCYYAAFGHAYRYARDYLGFVPRKRSEEKSQDHGRLQAFLARRRYADSVRLGWLRDWRNECDYAEDLAGMDLPQVGLSAVAAAEFVLRSLAPP
jgi:hypothetical protein